ncbi:beta-glucosidase 17-like isoform X3 [Fagus crenata]
MVQSFTYEGYATGNTAPGRCSDYVGNCTFGNSATEPYVVAHHVLLSHATTVKLYREKYQTPSGWLYIYPRGIRELVLYVKENFNYPPIIVTENGFSDVNNNSLPIQDALNDSLRLKYHQLYLSSLIKAIKAGINVKGYYVWSFLDDFEWEFGYTYRLGINYVDYKNGLTRYMKHTALWFKDFLQKENITTRPPLLYSDQ